ncbi:hypothetical protein DSO57_1022585 [Entomophthora muscae]|uniref:Uncharacterized protein n=1 Tax=Entomophthora muscae TaxID=34485 RepID=A0ACC2TEN7_9FUNG|nr:hypothetical protein DSO57_1022585 [Entomophthora muscae]
MFRTIHSPLGSTYKPKKRPTQTGPNHPATQRPSSLHASQEGVQHPQTDCGTAVQASLDPSLALPPLRLLMLPELCLDWVPAGHHAAIR